MKIFLSCLLLMGCANTQTKRLSIAHDSAIQKEKWVNMSAKGVLSPVEVLELFHSQDNLDSLKVMQPQIKEKT